MDTKIRKIIHIDMDAFYASVEQRDNPELRGRPVVVGGMPQSRGVVAACSYEARKFGIRSAMPSHQAHRLCPDAVFVSPRFAIYQEVSSQIREIFLEHTELVEPLSLDEAYLDVTDSKRLDGSASRVALTIKESIRQKTGLIASAGVSYNKFLAKIASDHDKPDGFCCIRPEQGEKFVAALPVGRFYGVGAVTEARMLDLGIRSGADMRAWSLAELTEYFGKSAAYYYDVCRGVDEREVQSARIRKSLGSETTFSENLNDKADMIDALERLCDGVCNGLKKRELMAASVVVKVRFSDFRITTRTVSFPEPTASADAFKTWLPLLLGRALATDNRPGFDGSDNGASPRHLPVRLLGVSASGLSAEEGDHPRQLGLFE